MRKFQNIDGLQKPNKNLAGLLPVKKNPRPPRTVFVDAIRRVAKPRQPPVIHLSPAMVVPFWSAKKRLEFDFERFFAANRALAVSALGIILAFGLGVGYAASTPKIAAENPLPGPVTTAAASAPIPLADAPAGMAAPKDDFFNTPLELLQSYLSSAQADVVSARKTKLREFLQNRNSPLEPQADLIAEQEHWKLILAISFAESTLGKHCFINNCSGIGGANIRAYKSLDNWIVDFNRLLEKRYKDKTLEQMCGVYVQPCSSNWLLATRQILTALDEQNIE